MKKNKYQIYKKSIVFFLFGISLFLILIGLFLSSYAYTEPIKKISFSSEILNYQNQDPASLKVDKGAEWIGYGKARITFSLDTILSTMNQNLDVIFVLDVSSTMYGEKLEKVKRDTKMLVNTLLADNSNQVALITFHSQSEIVSQLTNNKEYFSHLIDSLVTHGGTNYYQPLVNVDKILQNYEKQENRNCTVVFLTDGLPNLETPNQVGQYKYLKEKYPYLTIQGIQYEIGETVLEQIIEISDNQFIADRKSLKEVLEDALVVADQYEQLKIIDDIDNKYYELDPTSLKPSFGNATVKIESGVPKIIWFLDQLKTGKTETLTIDINLKKEYLEIPGLYPTNKEENITYKIKEIEESITSTKTPVLSNYYEVSYDGNPPPKCNINEIPKVKKYAVYDQVEINSQIPSCDGYQFSKWIIINKNVWQMNEDYFLMPEENVLLRAEWKKLSIEKKTDGDIYTYKPPIIQAIGKPDYNQELWKYKDSITKIVLQDHIGSLLNEKENFDISEARNGSVRGIVVPNQDDLSTYTAYIQGDSEIIGNVDSSYLFFGFSRLESIEGLEYLNTSKVSNMAEMFSNCDQIKEINTHNFDTSNVTNMSYMFSSCKNLETVDLTNFHTSNVTTMKGMFNNCYIINNLDFSSFDTKKVIDMSWMFYTCSMKMTELDISSFDTISVTNMSHMFRGNWSLETLIFDREKFVTQNVTDMQYMFYDCRMSSIDVSNFNTTKVTNMSNMFYQCTKLIALDVSHFDTANVTDMNSMFARCGVLENLDVSHFDTTNVTNMKGMFWGCHVLPVIDVSNFKTAKVTDMSAMFSLCYAVETLDVSGFDTSLVTDMSSMFQGCSTKLTTLDISNFNTRNVTNMSEMFRGNWSLATLIIRGENINTSKVTNMNYMFYDCGPLKELDVSHFDTSLVTDMSYMFSHCRNIETLNISHFNTTNVLSMSHMFEECNFLKSLDISNFDTSNVLAMDYMFNNCFWIENLELSHFNTSKILNMDNMFNNCVRLKMINLENFDFSRVTTADKMFANCEKLTTTINITSMTLINYPEMFNNAATTEDAQIKINYKIETSELVDRLLTTKSENSNVIKGTLID